MRDRPAPLYEWLISFGSLPELAENRVFKDKPGGLVVDYIGIAAELKNALRTYTDAKGNGQPTVKAEDALKILKEKLDVVRGMIHGFDYWQFETKPLQLLAPAANHILGLNDGKKRFLDVMASVTKTYSLCATLDEAAGLRTEIAFFFAIRAALVRHGNVGKGSPRTKRTPRSSRSSTTRFSPKA